MIDNAEELKKDVIRRALALEKAEKEAQKLFQKLRESYDLLRLATDAHPEKWKDVEKVDVEDRKLYILRRVRHKDEKRQKIVYMGDPVIARWGGYRWEQISGTMEPLTVTTCELSSIQVWVAE